jgi:peroxiredoxin
MEADQKKKQKCNMHGAKNIIAAIILVIIVAVVVLGCNGINKPSDNNDKPDNLSTLDTGSDNEKVIPQDGNVKDIKVGDIAPDFELKDVNGSYVSLNSLRGKKLLVNMWWIKCKGCREEMSLFQEIHEKWSKEGVIVLAINVYDRDEVIRAYAQNNKLSFMLLVDQDKKLNQSYIICGVPTTFFIDIERVVRKIQDGAFNTVEEIDNILESL